MSTIREYSPITSAFERVFRLLQFLPPQVLASRSHGYRSNLTASHTHSSDKTAKRSRSVEHFLLGYLALDLLAFGSTWTSARWPIRVALLWVALRIVDILQATINVVLFDSLRGRNDHRVAAIPRLIVLSFVNFGELLVCFSVFYAACLSELHNAATPWDALYFSVITQLTIGYGDLVPVGILRAVVVGQGLIGLVFLALVFARTVTALPPIKEIFPSSGGEIK